MTTKPLHGLFNNRPYFSRALDPDLTMMTHNEFHVAGMRSRHDPWFAVSTRDLPWLEALGVGSDPIGPEALREGLLTFFMDFSHEPNPAVVGRTQWSASERRGAELFQAQCAGCHEARLVTDRPDSRQPIEQWERLIFSPTTPIVWARDTYEQTGIVPYVYG